MTRSKLTEDQLKALEITKHITLTANAGSGKTFVLTQRFLEILLHTDTTLKQIAAITFTDKAAGELYGKISRSILEASLKAEDETERMKFEKLKKQLVSANISTIHSFCTQILREFPVEAGIDANFSPVDATLSKELISLSLTETINQFEKNPEKNLFLQEMIRHFGSVQNLSTQLEHAIYHRSSVKNLLMQIYSGDESGTANFFSRKLEEYLLLLFVLPFHALLPPIKRINAEAFKKNPAAATAISETIQVFETQVETISRFTTMMSFKGQLITTTHTIRKDGYLGRKFSADLGEDILVTEKYFRSLTGFETLSDHEKLHLQLAVFGLKFTRIFEAVLESYEGKKSELGYLDFDDILIKTQNVLEQPNVRQKLSQKYRYLMVDEYQDTNEIQYEIFLPILERLKSGNLFVVGDEKQSIYKFRDAELSVFSKTKNDVSNEDGLVLSLPASFRMSAALCAFTNELFRNLFADANPLFNEVVHTDLICARSDEVSSAIELLIAEEQENSEVTEAELIAKRIMTLTAHETSTMHLRDIAILCRKRNSFEILEKTFRKFNLPYIVWEGKGFYQQQIIFDFFNYISFLANTTDDAALVGILRSPFYFLSDSDLLSIHLQSSGNFWEKLKDQAKQNPRLSDIVSLLTRHQNLLLSADMVTLLRTISEETNYLAVAASRKDGKKELANFEKLILLTRSFYKQGFRNVYDYLKYLSDAIADFTDEGQAQVTADEDAIKIMTVHQAKGLEFDAVFIFECHKEGVNARIAAKEIQINKEFGLMTKLPEANSFSSRYLTPPISDVHNYIETKKEFAELKRLFYVAVTRAKNHLYFTATLKPEAKFLQKSFINLLSTGLNTNFETEQIIKSSNLIYLTQENETESKKIKSTPFSLKIIKEITVKGVFSEPTENDLAEFSINLSKIVDVQKEEIISATKVAIYHQCPTKYLLTYEYGYNELYDAYKKYLNTGTENKSQFEYNALEQNDDFQTAASNSKSITTIIPTEIKGKLIHAILEKDLPLPEVKGFVQKHFEVQRRNYSPEEISSFQEMLFSELSNFYSSATYRSLQSEKKFQNEFQVYLKEKDFYLFGIIDKVVFVDNSITIIDYKTDNLPYEEITSRAQDYFFQLTFYAYILKKLFPSNEKILLQIIFTKFPDEKLIHQVEPEELTGLETYLLEMISQIRSKNFKKNFAHCKQCHFSDKRNKCIF